MANSPVPQGFPNRVRGTVPITDVPALDVTTSYLGKSGVSVCLDDPITDTLPTITSIVSSQVPYQQVTLTVHMLHTQGLTVSCRQRFMMDIALGEVIVTPDAITFGNFTLPNYHPVNFNEMPFNGMDAGYVVAISDYLTTNNNMWI